MNEEELRRYLDVSVAHSVTIDVREVPAAPGYLRTIIVHAEGRVTIEFQKCSEYVGGDWEGGGLKYVGRYESVDVAVRELEKFLALPIGSWKNFTSERYEPLVTTEADEAANRAYFEEVVRERRVELPSTGRFEVAGIYWRHVQRYGEYRQDKLLEEQELRLRELGVDFGDES